MVVVGGPSYGSASSVVWLDQIPRTSPATMSSYNFNVGDKVTVYTNRKSTSFTHNIFIYFGGFEKQLASGVTDSWEWDTNNNIDELLGQMTTVNSLWGRIRVQTINGNTWIGDVDLEFILNVKDANPIFSNFTFQDINQKTVNLTGNNQILINEYSNVQATISNANKAVAQKKATMSRYRLQIGTKQAEQKYSDTQDVNITINNINNNILNMYAIDSRENSTLKTLSPSNFINYQPIIIKNIKTSRNNGGVGTEVLLEFDGYIWNDNFGIQQNSITECIYYYKKSSDTSEEWLMGESEIIPIIQGNSFSGSFYIKGDLDAEGFDTQNSYLIRIVIKDELSTDSENGLIGTGIPIMAISPNKGVAFGAPYDESLGGILQKENNIVYGAKVLYDNESGTSGTVTLSESAANFRKLEIILEDIGDAWAWKSFVILDPNGKYVTTDITSVSGSNQDTRTSARTIYINNTTITVFAYIVNYPKGDYWNVNEQKIFKVIGYR